MYYLFCRLMDNLPAAIVLAALATAIMAAIFLGQRADPVEIPLPPAQIEPAPVAEDDDTPPYQPRGPEADIFGRWADPLDPPRGGPR